MLGQKPDYGFFLLSHFDYLSHPVCNLAKTANGLKLHEKYSKEILGISVAKYLINNRRAGR